MTLLNELHEALKRNATHIVHTPFEHPVLTGKQVANVLRQSIGMNKSNTISDLAYTLEQFPQQPSLYHNESHQSIQLPCQLPQDISVVCWKDHDRIALSLPSVAFVKSVSTFAKLNHAERNILNNQKDKSTGRRIRILCFITVNEYGMFNTASLAEIRHSLLNKNEKPLQWTNVPNYHFKW